MGENSDLPVKRIHVGRFWDCRLCGKKIERGEEFVLTGTKPKQWLYVTGLDLWSPRFEKDGHMYHKRMCQNRNRKKHKEIIAI
jgi:hypothetical protein